MSITPVNIAARAALISAVLLLCAQTLTQAHVHEPATETACAVCTVSADHNLPTRAPATNRVTASRTAIPIEADPRARRSATRPYHTRAPPRS